MCFPHLTQFGSSQFREEAAGAGEPVESVEARYATPTPRSDEVASVIRLSASKEPAMARDMRLQAVNAGNHVRRGRPEP